MGGIEASGSIWTTYAYDALAKLTAGDGGTSLWIDITVVAGSIALALLLGATTLKRQTA